ncbi:MAG: peptidylprolyl isomerase [Reyranellaceae bacterium]
MRRWKLGLAAAAALVLASLAPLPAAAQQTELTKIAATVNEDIISVYDLISRTRLAIVASRLEDNNETRQRVARQLLRIMIEEKLQMQEAKRLGIQVSNKELEEAVQRIEQANRWPPGQFKTFLQATQIPPSAALDQIRANLLWQKVVRRRLRPQADVSDTEVDEALAKLRENIGKPENRVAEIFLPVERAEQEAEVQRAAEAIAQRVRAGTPFPELARQFSQSPSAGQGGDLGWLQPGQFESQLERAVASMQPREVSAPIRTLTGFSILYLIDRRTFRGGGEPGDANLQVDQLILPLPANARAPEVASQMNLAQQLAENAHSCADLVALAKEVAGGRASTLATGPASAIPGEARQAIGGLEVNQPSAPLRTAEGVKILMICKREGGDGLPSRDTVMNGLLQQRLELLARRYIRELRQTATVDIRI